jgi:hypothetical protein
MLVHIPHFSDNYKQIKLSIRTVIELIDDSFNALDIKRKIFKNDATDEEEFRINEMIEDYKVNIGEQFFIYTYILLLTATIEKNIKLLIKDKFNIDKKRELTKITKKLIPNLPIPESFDDYLEDLFELRNAIAHSLANLNVENNNKLISIVKKHNLEINIDKELVIKRQLIDDIAKKIDIIFNYIAEYVYN